MSYVCKLSRKPAYLFISIRSILVHFSHSRSHRPTFYFAMDLLP